MATKNRTSFNPTFTITPAVAGGLMRIEAVKQAIHATDHAEDAKNNRPSK